MHRTILWSLLLTLLAATAVAQSDPTGDALVDSLVQWHAENRPDRVDAAAGPAIATARADADSARLLTLLMIRGGTRAGFGRARDAEADLREARALAADRRDTLQSMQTVRWLSVAVSRQGRAAEADSLYRELETLARAADDSLFLGWAWVGLAYDHYLSGRTDSAVETYGRAAGVLERHGQPEGAAWAWNGRGLALRQAGRYREAREAFTRVWALNETGGHPLNVAMALDQLGRLDLHLGDPGRAVERFTRSVEIHRAHQHMREGLVPAIDLANALIMQGRFAEAEAGLDSVLTVCRANGLRDLEILATGVLIDSWLDQERPFAAVARCREILAGGAMPSRQTATEIRLRLAQALAVQGNLTEATTLLEQVLDHGAGGVSLELRTQGLLGSLLVDRGQAARAVDVLRPAAVKAADVDADAEGMVILTHLGRAEMALDRTEAALEAFMQAIAGWERIRAWPSDPIWREHRGTISGSLFAHTAAALLSDATDPDRLAEAWELVQHHKARTLQERMRGPDAVATASARPDLGRFQARVLRPGEVFIDIVEGEQFSVMFCLTPDTAFAELVPGAAVVRPLLRRLGDVVTSPALEDPAPAVALAQRIMTGWPESSRLLAEASQLTMWCPDGAWHRFPAVLLPDPTALARVPAAGVLARLRASPPPDLEDATILAVCGPDPEGADMLPGAAAEARWLAANLQGVRELEPQTTAVLDTTAWREADVLHLATHTVLDPDQPWNTAIHLAPGEGGGLRAGDVLGMGLSARLAVLAGCTTAGTRLVGGEGLIGLSGAFMAAHTPAVLATLWPVDDAVALLVTTAFYDALADGLPASAALTVAQRACRADPVGGAPRHWAAFTLVGDGAVTVPIRRQAARWPWAAALGALALGAWVRGRR